MLYAQVSGKYPGLVLPFQNLPGTSPDGLWAGAPRPVTCGRDVVAPPGARPGGQDGTLLRIGHQTTGEDVVITAPPSANGGAPDSLCAVSSLRSFFRGDAPRVTQPAFFPERGHGVCSWRPCLVFMLH